MSPPIFMRRTFLLFILLTVGVAQAETYLYDATGALLKAFGPEALSYGIDDALNVSSSSTAQPLSGVRGGQALLAVSVVPKTSPASTGISASANLSGLGGNAAAAMNDSGIGGDAVAGDGIYSLTTTVGAGTPLGNQLIEVTFTDAQGRTWTDLIPVDVQAVSEPDNPREDIPTLPEWGMILLGVLLVLLASRSLPRQAICCVAAAALAAFVPNIRAEIQDHSGKKTRAENLSTPPVASISSPTALQEAVETCPLHIKTSSQEGAFRI